MTHDATPIAPVEATTVTWNRQVDVVVVGLGAAGLAASIAAAEAGAQVLAIERTGAPGGTSAMSGGIVYLGGGTSTQQGAGVEDSPELMRRFLSAALGRDEQDPRLVTYCDGSIDHHDWLVEHGVPFRAEFWPEPGMEPPGTEGLVYSGVVYHEIGQQAAARDRLERACELYQLSPTGLAGEKDLARARATELTVTARDRRGLFAAVSGTGSAPWSRTAARIICAARSLAPVAGLRCITARCFQGSACSMKNFLPISRTSI